MAKKKSAPEKVSHKEDCVFLIARDGLNCSLTLMEGETFDIDRVEGGTLAMFYDKDDRPIGACTAWTDIKKMTREEAEEIMDEFHKTSRTKRDANNYTIKSVFDPPGK